jgi:endoglucanase
MQAEYQDSCRKETKALRSVRIKVWPMMLYFTFILTACFYFYARINHGMGGLSAGLQSYSYFVLFVEVLGSLNMLFYACWLFARPINDDVFPEAMANGDLPPLRRKYTVRVLIPCFKESLAIIQRTVLAARRADRPAGLRVIIYVCDDGADDRKSAWVSSLQDCDVIYITGRHGVEKSKNGKSANLNNTLKLIYPDIKDPANPDEFMKIPVHELMCLFDADQTCSQVRSPPSPGTAG